MHGGNPCQVSSLQIEILPVSLKKIHGSNPRVERTIGELISRRSLLQIAGATFAVSLLPGRGHAAETTATNTHRKRPGGSSLTFRELSHGNDSDMHVAEGYDAQVLLRWGDPILSNTSSFNPHKLSASNQARQFGYNCDYTAFLPLPRLSDGLLRGLMCVNHEYANTNLMFAGIRSLDDLETLSSEMVEIELAALGHSVVEIRFSENGWHADRRSRLNRRITAATPMTMSGPAAGHARLKTSDDPTGKHVIGTLNNCGGGVTPWGTLLICEENFNGYFSGNGQHTPEGRNHKRYGVGGKSRFNPAWAKHYARFDIDKEPHEPNRFGWVVEFDPHDPDSVPKKRTALGRFKHEGAGVVVNHDGRVVIYCGDDERFDYVYKFVSKKPFDSRNKGANRDLLDDGTLYVARFSEDGTMQWLPLVFGHGPLTADNHFHSQADVLIETRRAADLLGATPMDRPEDVEVSPKNGHVFVILTNNSKRTPEQVNKSNPQAANEHGHILELIPPSRDGHIDHAAVELQWDVFLRAGDLSNAKDNASYHTNVTNHGWFSCPDNGAFDRDGRFWLTTDSDHKLTGFGDGIYALDTEGPGRALPKLFFRGPRGSEVSGVCLSPDSESLFVSVQHPGEERESDFQKPSTRWPDFKPGVPPRPAVVAITRRGGGKIGE